MCNNKHLNRTRDDQTILHTTHKVIHSKLTQRGNDYGDYYVGVKARSSIMNLLEQVHIAHTTVPFTDAQRETLHDVVNKLVRLAATPDHVDSWHDIIGYTNCILTDIDKVKTNAKK